MRRQTDLLAVAAVSVVAALLSSLLPASNIVKAALGAPMVLFLPGYALSAALLPDGRAGLAERLAISLGLSIAVAALGGLVLNLLPRGLTPGAWRVLLLGVTLSAAGYAYWRRQTRQIPGPGPLVTKFSMRDATLVASAALLIGLALGLGGLGVGRATISAASDADPFTQLWMLPGEDAPTNSGHQTVRVGLRNNEKGALTYRVTLQGGDNVFVEWPQVTLASGESWQAQATVPADMAGLDVIALAYREGDETPYRRVRLSPLYTGEGQ